MSPILVPSKASELYLSAIAVVIMRQGWEFVTLTPAGSKKPVAFASLTDWTTRLMDLPKGLYVHTFVQKPTSDSSSA